jgi:hypothetical protein
MEDKAILETIGSLVDEEHALYRRSEHDGGLEAEEHERLRSLQVALDQCWDLLDQRRALRSAGKDPNQAHLRDPETVEKYLQ